MSFGRSNFSLILQKQTMMVFLLVTRLLSRSRHFCLLASSGLLLCGKIALTLFRTSFTALIIYIFYTFAKHQIEAWLKKCLRHLNLREDFTYWIKIQQHWLTRLTYQYSFHQTLTANIPWTKKPRFLHSYLSIWIK